MPYKVFVAGEEALAADVNSYLMSQTVPRFTNATQRTSQLTAPVLNQLTMLDSRPGIVQYWDGSSWIDVRTSTDGWIGVTPGTHVAPSTTAVINIVPSRPIPFSAAVILEVAVVLSFASGTDAGQLVDLKIGGGSTSPAPTQAPVSSVWPNGAPKFGIWTVPVWALWTGLTAGASFVVDLSVTVGGAGAAIRVDRVTGSYRNIPG